MSERSGFWRRAVRVLLVTLPLTGCASLELGPEEFVWQTLHAVDVAQTLSAAADPCYVENAPLTKELIGAQPSTTGVLLWGVGTAVGHALISGVLAAQDAPPWVQKSWSIFTIGSTAYAVGGNHVEGVRVFGANKPVPGCS